MHHIICHMDADGYTSAAIYYHYLRRVKEVPESVIRIHPINYGMRIPDDILHQAEMCCTDDHVAILDFTLESLVDMYTLKCNLGDRFTWIDHHKTVLETLERHPEFKDIPGIRRIHHTGHSGLPCSQLVAACELTWEHCHGLLKETPNTVRWIGDWDTWRWTKMAKEQQDIVQRFEKGLYLEALSLMTPEGKDWWMLLMDAYDIGDTGLVEEIEDKILNSGMVVSKYQQKAWYSDVRSRSFEATFLQYNVLMINAKGTSDMFRGFFDKEKHDFVVVFHDVRGTHMKVSMYSDNPESKIHLGQLATTLGHFGGLKSGGGHVGAAGFQTTPELFKMMYQVIGPVEKIKKEV